MMIDLSKFSFLNIFLMTAAVIFSEFYSSNFMLHLSSFVTLSTIKVCPVQVAFLTIKMTIELESMLEM